MMQVTNVLLEHARSPDTSVSSAALFAVGVLACSQISGAEYSVLSARLVQSLRARFHQEDTARSDEEPWTPIVAHVHLLFESIILTCGHDEVGLLLQEAWISR